jgi:hypothetical protein
MAKWILDQSTNCLKGEESGVLKYVFLSLWPQELCQAKGACLPRQSKGITKISCQLHRKEETYVSNSLIGRNDYE